MSLRLEVRLRSLLFIALGLCALVGVARSAFAQGQTATGTASIHGHIADQTGALIPGAKITVTTADGKSVGTATADASGAYSVTGLEAGNYIVKTTFAGFADFQSQPIPVAAGQVKRVDVAMAIEVEQQNIVVSDDTPTVSVDAGSNASSMVLKDKDLDALSDDPDELSNELTALAGPSAGPNGGQIYIDGFTGGQLPPKSAIREIRVNQNPFSAEYDRLGYGRIEILTKPGTDKLHGQVFVMGNDSATNTGSPFLPNVPPYYRIQYNASVSGALSKKASFYLSVEQRDNHDQAIYNYYPAVLDPGTGLYSISPTRASGAVSNPHNHINISPRLDLQLGKNDTMTLRYQWFYNSETGDIGSTELPSQSVTTTTKENSIQLSDSHIINDRMVNETRFEYRRSQDSTTPVSTSPTLMVSGDFTGGGASEQASNDHTDHFELQNYTTMALGRQSLKFGAWVRDNRDANSSFSNRNGSVVFTEKGYVDALNALAQGQSLSTLPAGDFVSLSVTAGRTAYTTNLFDGALFIQDDWKVNPRLTVSGGLRWETQNHLHDHNDWAPRVAFAYALDAKGNKPAKTVLRAGYGIFYDRLPIGSLLSATQRGFNSGQVQTTAFSPSCLSGTDINNLDFSGCMPAAPYSPTPQTTLVQISPTYHSPYTQQLGASLERQLTKSVTVTGTYLHSFGVHQIVTRDANPYTPAPGTTYYNESTGPRLNPSVGIIQEFYPEAVFKQNQMILNVNARISQKLGFFGFYNLSFANTNGAGGFGGGSFASNSYNLDQDYGRAAFVNRNMLFVMGNYTGPWALRFNPFLIARSGRPYNIVSGTDLTGDNFVNNRPSYADASMCTGGQDQYFQTQFGCLNSLPSQGDNLIPMNLGNGPASVALNLRVSKSVGVGPKLEASGGVNGGGFGGPGGPGGGHGGRGMRGGPGGGLGPGGLGGGRGGPGGMMGPAGTGHKYNLTFSVEANNLFNNVNYGTPVGTLGSSEFGRSTSLANGPFSGPGGSTSRRVFFQAAFAF
ncbi:MAG: TonB-dependent receptor [Acidobacteria bacterium]|nr:TonB-dependent receptor [Acidobacteriota bacterium]